MPGKTKIVETGRDTTILLDADAGKVAVGGANVDGAVEVITGGHVVGVLRAQPQTPTNPQRPVPLPSGGLIELSKPDGKPPQIVLNAGTGSVRAPLFSAPLFSAINHEGKTTVRVDGDEATITVGAEGKVAAFLDGVAGKFELGEQTELNHRKIEMDSRQGLVKLGLPVPHNLNYRPIELKGDNALITLGCPDLAGAVHLRDAESLTTIKLDGASGTITLGTNLHSGDIVVTDERGRDVCHIDGKTAAMRLGSTGAAGEFRLEDEQGRVVVRAVASSGTLYLGTNGRDGDLVVTDDAGRDVCHIDGQTAAIRLGTNGRDGDLVVTDEAGRDVCHIDGKTAAMRIGNIGAAGAFLLADAQGRVVVRLDSEAASVAVGSAGNAGQIRVRKKDGTDSIQIDGESGDILLSNADCAEEFDFAATQVDPGTVVVIDEDERLAMSTLPYDTRVAGVVSGAGRYRPAIVLDRRQGGVTRPAVAMVGKVECRVDAEHGPIRCGDLLVSSPTPGHAMAAKDRSRAMGAVLGKALRSMDEGQGLIPILVCLQ